MAIMQLCCGARAKADPGGFAQLSCSVKFGSPLKSLNPKGLEFPDCGLNDADRQQLCTETTRVIHCAATVRFDHTLEEARHMNVDGTRKMLDFAASMHSLKSFIYVGTAYVAGEREGLILESELNVGQRYRNTYEQTKAEAEALVRSRQGSLPSVILRPSIIVGDSETGVTSSFKMLYWPLKIYSASTYSFSSVFPSSDSAASSSPYE